MLLKKMTLSIAFLSAACLLYSQEIVNLVLVGNDGITEDVKKAHSFIVVKRYPGNVFERLDYKMQGPLVKLRTYKDSVLEILHGKYIDYSSDGTVALTGDYADNLRQGDWLHLNDTGKVILKEVYENGNMVRAENPDTIKKKEPVVFGDEKEAEFKGGIKAWQQYLFKNLDPEAGFKCAVCGKVRVTFMIDTTGKTTDVYIRKSVEFVLDEEALRIIRQSPLWQPAFQDGKKVNAYRLQPLTFLKPE